MSALDERRDDAIHRGVVAYIANHGGSSARAGVRTMRWVILFLVSLLYFPSVAADLNQSASCGFGTMTTKLRPSPSAPPGAPKSFFATSLGCLEFPVDPTPCGCSSTGPNFHPDRGASSSSLSGIASQSSLTLPPAAKPGAELGQARPETAGQAPGLRRAAALCVVRRSSPLTHRTASSQGSCLLSVGKWLNQLGTKLLREAPLI